MIKKNKGDRSSNCDRPQENPKNQSSNYGGNATSTEAQRNRILAALRRRPQTTEDLRKLGIFQVPVRVKELRDRFGYRIETTRVTIIDREGYEHPRAALYSLCGQPEGVV